jgi:hypothetical protein
MKSLKTVIALIIVAITTSCDKDPVLRDMYFDPLLAAELRLSQETIQTDANTLALQTYLWRDFMPISPADGKPLISINKLSDIDSAAVSSGIQMVKQHVINDDLVWTANYSEVSNADSLIWEGVSREGPKWGPDIMVDVVCEFVFQGTTYRIIARNQEIIATH